MTLDFTECPPDLDEVAEAYVMGTLAEEQVIAFEEHYIGCDACAKVLQDNAQYIDAIRAAATSVRSVRSRPQRDLPT